MLAVVNLVFFSGNSHIALRDEHRFSCLKRTVAPLRTQGGFDIVRSMRNESLKLAFLLFGTVATTAPLQAAVKLGLPFSDHMVLQREKPVAVWGWADALKRLYGYTHIQDNSPSPSGLFMSIVASNHRVCIELG